jgi:hypothetical protein
MIHNILRIDLFVIEDILLWKSKYNDVRNRQIKDVVFDIRVFHGLIMHATPGCYP